MADNNRLKDNIQILSRLDKKVFDKVCNNLIRESWDAVIEYDLDWGWIVLATKVDSEIGIILRRIKPFALNSTSDFERALKMQIRLKLQLVEILPYKVFLGNKISLGETYKPFNFFSKADFPFWSKFFKGQKNSLKSNSIDEAKKLEENQLVRGQNFVCTNNFDLKGGDGNAR